MIEENKMEKIGPEVTAAHEKLQSSKNHARQAAQYLRKAAGVFTEEYRDKAGQAWRDGRDRVRTFQEDAEGYVRQNPTKAVFTALAIGFVVGLVLRR
jgi:ElaB/YqjD/DUF883 family membrane-anchored ribosome-binding protein